jgi:hypothetical protein
MPSIRVVPLDEARMGSERAAFIAQWRQLMSSR